MGFVKSMADLNTSFLASPPVEHRSEAEHDKPYVYWKNCVGFGGPREVAKLTEMIDNAVDITYGTFFRYCDLNEATELLGYEKHHTRGLILKKDWHVSYHRSKYNGKTVYFLKHSAIEYIFVQKHAEH
jgi:hypothetical protein